MYPTTKNKYLKRARILQKHTFSQESQRIEEKILENMPNLTNLRIVKGFMTYLYIIP